MLVLNLQGEAAQQVAKAAAREPLVAQECYRDSQCLAIMCGPTILEMRLSTTEPAAQLFAEHEQQLDTALDWLGAHEVPLHTAQVTEVDSQWREGGIGIEWPHADDQQ